jgi:hypothetical protein
MKVRMYQSLKAVALALVLGALFAPSAFADPPSGLDPWAYNALRQHQMQNTVPLSENTIGVGNEPSVAASRGGLDPWAYNALRQNRAGSSVPVSENTIGLRDRTGFSTERIAVQAPAASATLGGFHWGDAAIGASLAALLGLLGVGGTIARRRRTSLAH